MADIVGTQGNDVLQGGAQDDLLQGLGGNDTLDGGGGTNRLEGDTGNDTFVVHSSSDTAVENAGEGIDIVFWSGAGAYLLPGNIEDLTLEAGASAATGNALDNTIFANINVDNGVSVTLDGGAGADSVWGGANDDMIFGGDGNDFLDGAGGGDEIHGGAGNDHIRGESFSFGVGWNDILFGDAGDDLLFGLDGNDSLTGGSGNDILDGYAGDDTMNGGAGADWFQVDVGTNGLDRDVVQDFSDGEDQILLALDGLTAPDMSFVSSIAQAAADTVVSFTSGAEMRLLGVSAGSITANDFFFYQDGSLLAETLTGGSFRDVLWGEGGNDRLVSGAGADLLDGGTGRDQMTGGSGADIFDYDLSRESGNTSSTRDFVTDFTHLLDDFDLSSMDASTVRAGNNAFVWRGTGAFTTGSQGELRFQTVNQSGTANDRTILYGDTDGDTPSEFQIEINGLVSLTTADVLL